MRTTEKREYYTTSQQKQCNIYELGQDKCSTAYVVMVLFHAWRRSGLVFVRVRRKMVARACKLEGDKNLRCFKMDA